MSENESECKDDRRPESTDGGVPESGSAAGKVRVRRLSRKGKKAKAKKEREKKRKLTRKLNQPEFVVIVCRKCRRRVTIPRTRRKSGLCPECLIEERKKNVRDKARENYYEMKEEHERLMAQYEGKEDRPPTTWELYCERKRKEREARKQARQDQTPLP